ncbi:carbohydrate ABC transporter permease [Aureimonas leprariae]|uniref:Sugar ABC transporter permease n=1 Tax=Plantimonas leprariae TaxID=2615207 RepID=A0A7V7PLW0_9HYPH|nr:sugar ABC transporter permease [Aureimonas leprariae]KAB0677545.1 sugar ABC transporter permease [Aureimonas leprariae]
MTEEAAGTLPGDGRHMGRFALRRRSGRSVRAGQRSVLAGLALPSIVLMAAINAYPLVFALVQSMHGGGLLRLGRFVGFRNYLNVFADPAFWSAATFTLIFTLCGVFGSWIVGFGLAVLLKPRFPGRSLFKVLLLLPWIVPIVVTSMSWNWLVATPRSLLPSVMEGFGLGPVMFLANPAIAMLTVCLFKIWISYPFMMMMGAAALESIDKSIYEAATLDGATPRQQLRHIVLPMTARSTFISWILMTMFSVNDFATIYLLTGGGPVNATTSLIVLAYRSVFQDFLPGYGIAISFAMTAVLVCLSLLLFRQVRKMDL